MNLALLLVYIFYFNAFYIVCKQKNKMKPSLTQKVKIFQMYGKYSHRSMPRFVVYAQMYASFWKKSNRMLYDS